MNNKGFTLIELSIVLIIIGLIIGGILAGQNLVQASNIQTLISGLQNYQTSLNTFKLKYNCLAGDCPNFTTFFSGTSNGNGNYLIEINNEQYYVWQHLSLAGMIDGTYTGATSTPPYNPGVNVPASKIPNVSFGFEFDPVYGTSSTNALVVAKSRNTDGWPNFGAFTPSDAQVIDKKIDDGLPAKGKILTLRGADVYLNTVCTDQSYTTTPTGTVNYKLDDKTNSCRIWYLFN